MSSNTKKVRKNCPDCGKSVKTMYNFLCWQCYSKETSKLGNIAQKEATIEYNKLHP